MTDDFVYDLPEASRLALASARGNRSLWLAFLALDARLGHAVLSANEPILAQVRLAWWREQLECKEGVGDDRDPLAALIRKAFGANLAQLIPLVDGWESWLSNDETLSEFVESRGAATQVLARTLDAGHHSDAGRAGKLWALADVAYRGHSEPMRTWALEQGVKEAARTPRLPLRLRPLAVLAGLGRRSLKRGGTPMVGDRFSPLVAMRLGLLGI